MWCFFCIICLIFASVKCSFCVEYWKLRLIIEKTVRVLYCYITKQRCLCDTFVKKYNECQYVLLILSINYLCRVRLAWRKGLGCDCNVTVVSSILIRGSTTKSKARRWVPLNTQCLEKFGETWGTEYNNTMCSLCLPCSRTVFFVFIVICKKKLQNYHNFLYQKCFLLKI